MSASHDELLRSTAAGSGKTLLAFFVDLLTGPLRERCTLLAVSPNSVSVARAALIAAEEARAPAILAATLNQIDRDNGYTGFTPASFTAFLRDEAGRLKLSVPVIPCLDHGGPWLKDDHARRAMSFDETMAEVKQSLNACIDAGYELLHIDPTVDRMRTDGGATPIDVVAERTLDLIAHAEDYRTSTGAPRISYEVGTEEVHGGLADTAAFRRFLKLMEAGLNNRGLDRARPVFIVGKVGTDLHTSTFDPAVASALTSLARPFGSLIKGHYTDFVDNPDDYPRSGMGGANVGPEFSQTEYEALRELAAFERKIGKSSGIDKAVDRAVEMSGRWKKWLTKEEQGVAFRDLRAERRAWLLRTGSRYVWNDPEVREARARLYDHVGDFMDADAYVLWRLKKSILRYHHAFNLYGFCRRAVAAAGGVPAGEKKSPPRT